MKEELMKRISILLVVVLIVAALVIACGQKPAPAPTTSAPAPATTAAPKPAATTSAAPATTTTAAPKPSATTPAQAAQPITWKIQGSFEAAHFNYINAVVKICEGVTTASGGRLVFKPFAGGGITPIMKELDGVDKNMIEGCYTCTMYNTDKWPAAALYSGYPGCLPAEAFRIWYNQGGGLQLLEKLVTGFNVQPISGCEPQPPEIFLHSTKEIKSMADMKGLRVRAAGDGGAILNKMGCSVITMSGTECYEAVQRGVLDAFELAGPSVNWSLRAQEIAKYAMFSEVRAPSDAIIFYANKAAWEKLPADLKEIVTEAVQTYTQLAHEKVTQDNVMYLAKFKEYGTIFSHAPEDVEKTMLQEAQKFYAEKMAKEAPIYKEIYESQQAFKKTYSEYAGLNVAKASL